MEKRRCLAFLLLDLRVLDRDLIDDYEEMKQNYGSVLMEYANYVSLQTHTLMVLSIFGVTFDPQPVHTKFDLRSIHQCLSNLRLCSNPCRGGSDTSIPVLKLVAERVEEYRAIQPPGAHVDIIVRMFSPKCLPVSPELTQILQQLNYMNAVLEFYYVTFPKSTGVNTTLGELSLLFSSWSLCRLLRVENGTLYQVTPAQNDRIFFISKGYSFLDRWRVNDLLYIIPRKSHYHSGSIVVKQNSFCINCAKNNHYPRC
ncbi:hypothetical protein Pelo_15487 [Pelomyxa schiedti]|nr:hypothetical protein Pelo_15487 [Pelomyxa schiedti]